MQNEWKETSEYTRFDDYKLLAFTFDTYSFPIDFKKLPIPFEPSGEYAVTIIFFSLQKSTNSFCCR